MQIDIQDLQLIAIELGAFQDLNVRCMELEALVESMSENVVCPKCHRAN
jgi:Zn finger protein HypA/HybF involved in hydrogenase expression